MGPPSLDETEEFIWEPGRKVGRRIVFRTLIAKWSTAVTRVILPVALTVVLFISTISFIAVPALESNLMAAKKETIQELTTTVWNLLGDYESRVQNGELSREEAQARAIARVRELRYGPEGRDYFWINDMHPTMVMHPYRVDLDGQDISGFADPNGKRLFVEFVRVVEETGVGYVDYMWQWKDEPDRIVPKTSYVMGFEPWGWVIGTGVYTDDVNRRIASVVRKLQFASASILLLVVVLSSYIVWAGIKTESERRQAEHELRESQRRLIDIVDFLPDATMVIDRDGRVIAWSRAMETMTGVPSTDMVGKGEYEYAVPFYGERRPILIDLVLESQEDIEKEYTFIKRGGTRLVAEAFVPLLDSDGSYIEASASVLRDAHGNITGAIESLRDITEQKRAEIERERLQGQLRQSQKMDAIGQLAGGIAHDFNNLLQAILGYTEMAIQTLSPEDALCKDMIQVQSAAEKAATLTRQLLTFGRRQELQAVDMDLNVLVKDLLKILRRVIGEHIELTFTPAKGLSVIHADEGMIEQVLMNLSINARDAMPSGGTLTVEAENVTLTEGFCESRPWAEPGDFTRLSVTDTGTGIPPDVLERIFEPFFTTKEEAKGTGLGLAIVYGIVRQHGGFVHVDSELDRGTVFAVYLPSAGAAMEAREVGARRAMTVGGTETILLSEDDDAVREFAARVLEENGYTVLSTRDGEEAVRTFEANADTIMLTILDAVMPKLSGWETYDRIRGIREKSPVLFCSGYSSTSMHSSFTPDEGFQLLQKPYAPNDLLSKVRETLDAV